MFEGFGVQGLRTSELGSWGQELLVLNKVKNPLIQNFAAH